MPKHDYLPSDLTDYDRDTQVWYGPDAHGPIPRAQDCTCERLSASVRITDPDCAVHWEPDHRLSDPAYDAFDPDDRVERVAQVGRRSERAGEL